MLCFTGIWKQRKIIILFCLTEASFESIKSSEADPRVSTLTKCISGLQRARK